MSHFKKGAVGVIVRVFIAGSGMASSPARHFKNPRNANLVPLLHCGKYL